LRKTELETKERSQTAVRNPLVEKQEIMKEQEQLEIHSQKDLFEDTKVVIRIRKSKKNRQYNGKRKSTKGQTTVYKTYIYIYTKDRVTRTPLKTGD